MISQLGWSSSASTVDAAEDLAFLFHSMSNDAAATVRGLFPGAASGAPSNALGQLEPANPQLATS